MLGRLIVLMTVCVLAVVACVGCGDASAEFASKCAAMCQHAEDCPGLTWAVDCDSICEESVADAEVLGGTCPELLDEVIACRTQLTCGEIFLRNTGGFYDDECVAKERALSACEPERFTPGEVNDEFEFACQAFCDTAEACPTLDPDADCVDACVATFSGFENGTDLCTQSLLNDITCQASLSCTAISNRVNGVFRQDACSEADAIAEAACF